MAALDALDQIVCVDRFSDAPESIATIPHLKEHQTITKEMLEEWKPELIITETAIQEHLQETLQDDRWTIMHCDPRSVADVYDSIKMLGVVLDRGVEANALMLRMRQEFNDVERKAKLLPRKPRVYIEEWHHPPMVSGNWVPDIVTIAGGIPFPLPATALSREVSLAEVQTFDPDLIVLSICGAGRYAEKKLLTDRDGWSALRVVRGNHLRIIDDALLNRPGPRLTDGARRLYGWLFELCHS